MASRGFSDIITVLRWLGCYHIWEGPRAKLWKNVQIIRLGFNVTLTLVGIWRWFVNVNSLLNSSPGSALPRWIHNDNFSRNVCYCLLSLMTSFVIIHFYKMRYDVAQLFERMESIRKKYPEPSSSHYMATMQACWNIVRTFLIVGVVYGLSKLVPLFKDVAAWVKTKDLKSFNTPNPVLDLFLYDDESDKDFKYFTLILVSHLWSTNGVFLLMGTYLLMMSVLFYYSALVRGFSTHLELGPSTPEQTTNYIKSLCAHHQELFIITRRMRTLFGYPFFATYISGALSICFFLYVFTKSGGSKDLFMMLTSFLDLAVLIVLMALPASIGQGLTDQSLVIRNALYDFPWYELKPSDRKYFLLMITASAKPFVIHFHGQAPMDVTSLMAMMNGAYSYYTFMRSTF